MIFKFLSPPQGGGDYRGGFLSLIWTKASITSTKAAMTPTKASMTPTKAEIYSNIGVFSPAMALCMLDIPKIFLPVDLLFPFVDF